LSSSLSLSISPAHPDLPPFPTRRSSDLSGRVAVARSFSLTRSFRFARLVCFPRGIRDRGGHTCLVARSQPHELTHHFPRSRRRRDRKSTRLNSSHVKSSYAVFCLKKNEY